MSNTHTPQEYKELMESVKNHQLDMFLERLFKCLKLRIIEGALFATSTMSCQPAQVKILRVGVLSGSFSSLWHPQYSVVHLSTPAATWRTRIFTRLFFFLPHSFEDMILCVDLDTSDENFCSTLGDSAGCSAYFSKCTGGYEVAIDEMKTRFTVSSTMVRIEMMDHLLGRQVEYENGGENLRFVHKIVEELSLKCGAGGSNHISPSEENLAILKMYMSRVAVHLERIRYGDNDHGFAVVHLGRRFFDLWKEVESSGNEPVDGSQHLADIEEIVKNWREGIATFDDWRRPVECTRDDDSAEEEADRFYRRWAEENREKSKSEPSEY